MTRTALTLAVCTLALLLAPAGLAQAEQSTDDAQRVLVVFDAERALPADVGQMVELASGELLRAMPQVGLLVASGDAGFASRMERTAHVQAVVPDEPLLASRGEPAALERPGTLTALAAHDPSSAKFFDQQWNMRAIDADDAWAAGFRGDPSVTVAILDTGIDPTHRDLAGAVDASRSASFVDDVPGLPQCSDNSLIATYFPGAPAWTDLHTHGTHVSGIVAAQGYGISGVAPDVTLIAVKVANVCGQVSPSAAIAGAVHAADQGADVINVSLAIRLQRSCRTDGEPDSEPRNVCAATLSALGRAASYARQRGALVVAAAGNNALDLDHARDVTVVPADLATVMGVSATAPVNGFDHDTPASYTNYGTSLVDVAAPGGRFAGGQDMVLSLCSNFSLLYPECRGTNAYQHRAGTSFAAPHVAGVAALADSAHQGDLTGAQLQSTVEQTADDVGSPGTDPFFGRGRVNAFRAATP